MRPYPAYKDSGVEWLGDVPEGWGVLRLKQSIESCRNGIWGDDPETTDDPIICVRVADFDRQALVVRIDEPTLRAVTESERLSRLLRPGNLLLEKSGGGEGQPVGAVVLFNDDVPAVCSNFVARIELATNMHPSFWLYAHRMLYDVRVNVRSIKQTSGIQNLDQSAYFDEVFAFPPLPEQQAIAGFLDVEVGKIDALVAEQRRLIGLLAEKRQAVISHAVTRGLNPQAPLKPSGIDWLGDVPEGWEVVPLKHLSPAIAVGVVVNPSESVSDEGLPFIYGGDISEGNIAYEKARRIAPEVSAKLSKSQLRQGDLLTVRVGAPGVTAVVGPEGEGGNCASVMLIRKGKHPSDWLCYAMNSRHVRFQVEVVQYGAAQEQFNISHAVDFRIVTPPKHEAAELVAFLDAQTTQLDTLTTTAQSAIDLLQERRAALISAAVTGKIDLRHLIPQTVKGS